LVLLSNIGLGCKGLVKNGKHSSFFVESLTKKDKSFKSCRGVNQSLHPWQDLKPNLMFESNNFFNKEIFADEQTGKNVKFASPFWEQHFPLLFSLSAVSFEPTNLG
jgi:hypothetical protein